MQQVIIDFGRHQLFGREFSLRIYGYGLMLVLGFVFGICLARWRARRAGENHHAITTVGLLALIGGVVGARLAFVIEKWDEQFAPLRQGDQDPLVEILNITSGGLVYYGGVALAVALILVYLRARRLPIRRYLDIITPSLMIGLAFGRAGCLLNGCCYGGRCREDFPLAMRFPYASKPLLKLDRHTNVFGGASVCPVFTHQVAAGPGAGGLDVARLPPGLVAERPDPRHPERAPEPVLKSPADLTEQEAEEALSLSSLPVQPAQAYGIFNALLLAGILLCFSRLRRREGQVFATMLILYPVTRIVLESIRGDNPHHLLRAELTHNQWTSLGVVAAGVALWFLLRLVPGRAGPAWGERLAAEASREPSPRGQRKGR